MNTVRRLAKWSGPLVGATFLSGVFGAIAIADRRFPRLGSADADVKQYYEANPWSAIISAAGQITSAASLFAFALAVDRFATRVNSPASARVANAIGGGTAAIALGYSAASTARLGAADRMDPGTAAMLSRRAFVAGGPVHGIGFGIMVGALTATGARSGVLTRPTATLGAVAGVAGISCPAYFLAEPAGWLIPIGRFSGLAFIALAGRKL